MKKILLTISLIFISHSSYSACGPNQFFMRAQWINSYTKFDGTNVSAYEKAEHCRDITRINPFQNHTNQDLKHINFVTKAWDKGEKELAQTQFEQLPTWIKAYLFKEILRGKSAPGPTHHATMMIPTTRTIIIFDHFFTLAQPKMALIHSIAHLIAMDLEPQEFKSFMDASGWNLDEEIETVPPSKLLLPSSSQSPEEDFANYIEQYYSNPEKVKDFNSKAFNIIQAIVTKREKK